MAIDGITRRDFGKLFGVAGLAALVGYNPFAAKQAEAANGQYSDRELEAMMAQPVATTLAGANVVPVNDDNYQDVVFGANSPVMVLFYNEKPSGTAVPLSRGSAALTRVLSERFPQVRFCAFHVIEGTYDDGTKVSVEEVNRLKFKYGAKCTPAILAYDNDAGKVEYDDQMEGGIEKFASLKKNINLVSDYIKNSLLD